METGVATCPITDWAAYEKQLKSISCSLILLFQSAVKNDDVFNRTLCFFICLWKEWHINVR